MKTLLSIAAVVAALILCGAAETPELPLVWNGGEGQPSSVMLTLKTPAPDQPLLKLMLRSRSINKWWSISEVKLEGVRTDGTAVTLCKQPWYNRGDDNSVKTFELELDPGKQPFPEYRLTLSRPHGYIHMELSGLEPTFANQIRVEAEPVRSACRVGQTVEGKLRFRSTAAATSGTAVLETVDKNGHTTVWSEPVTIPPGESTTAWSFPAARTGEFRLEVRLESGPKLVSDSPVSLLVLPKQSRYHLPVGTAHGSVQSGALGFNVAHDWQDTASLTDRQLTGMLKTEKLTSSNCGPQLETEQDGRNMVDADGKTLNCVAMHAPRHLSPDAAARFRALDGHPGLSEIVYYNEHGYHTWRTGGIADYSKYTLVFYRKYLADLYKDISKLNALYGTKYRSFGEIQPPRKFMGPSADWFDWMEFHRVSVAEYFKEAYRLFKPCFPNTPITPKPINFDYYTVSTATDPWLDRDACDVYGYDIYPFQREGYLDPVMSLDYHRTQVGGKDLQFLESNFEFRRDNQTEKLDSDMHLLYIPAFLHGLRGVYFYCWYQGWSEVHRGFWLRNADGVLTPQGRGAAQVAKAAQTLSPVLMTGKVLPAPAAVYFPWEEISQTPNVAPVSAMRGAYKLLTQLQYPTDIISYHNILEDGLKNYQILVLPLSRHLRPEVAEKIKAFVRNGGILVTEYQAGRFDQYHREKNQLGELCGFKSLGTTDQFTTFDCGKDKEIRLYAPITKESPFGWKHRPNIMPIDRAEKGKALPGATVLATFPNGSPAIVENTYGKGRVLYFAATFFNSYRNYFYTLNTLPSPATRGNEIINVGDRSYRKILRDFFARCDVKPPIEVEVYDDDVEKDDSPFLILSRFSNGHCALFGVANWGPHERNQVPFRAELPFSGVKRLLVMDTVRETVKELPFTEKDGVLSATLPQLDKSLVLIAVRDGGPVLVSAAQPGEGNAVEVKVENLLNEPLKGELQLRIDGVEIPLSPGVACELAPGEAKTFRLTPDPAFPAKRRYDNRGERLPWYVWLTYDGDARAFGRVHPNPGGLSAP